MRDHGEERKYCCQYCGARFIQIKHLQRHVKQFHEGTDNPRNPQKRERGPNKRPYKQAIREAASRSPPNVPPAQTDNTVLQQLMSSNQEMENPAETFHRRMLELAHASWSYN